jgi:hypothetical protein
MNTVSLQESEEILKKDPETWRHYLNALRLRFCPYLRLAQAFDNLKLALAGIEESECSSQADPDS